MLRIQLVGSFRVWKENREITDKIIQIGKADTIVKLLVTEPGQMFSHDQLIQILWGKEIEEGKTDLAKAAGNLRRRISALRTLLDSKKNSFGSYIHKNLKGYSWNSRATHWIDVEEFNKRCHDAHRLFQEEQWSQAITLYESVLQLSKSEYLAEDRYAEWAQPLRERWQKVYEDVLEEIAESCARQGQYRRAIRYCQQLLDSQKLREDIYRRLMLYYYLAGSIGEALHAYAQCRQMLKDMGVEPARETITLYEQIRVQHIPGVDKSYPPPPIVRHQIPYALSPGNVPFVGREVEFAHLSKYAEEAHQGQGCCVLLRGEAGVGKTRLIREFLNALSAHSEVHVLTGRCFQPELQLPYQPWAEVFRELIEKAKNENLQTILPIWLAEVAKLVPELRARFPNLPENLSLPPQQEQLRFFEGCIQFFLSLVHRDERTRHTLPRTKRASSLPMVIFLDDLHWADKASLDLLNYLLLRINKEPILILGAYRSEEVNAEHPLQRLVLMHRQNRLLHAFSLPRLKATAVKQLMRRLPLHIENSKAFYTRLYRETEGHPLFLINMLQHFFEEGRLKAVGKSWVADHLSPSEEWKIPPTIKSLIAQRVAKLGRTARKLLQLASVLGRDVELPILEQAWEGKLDEYEIARETLAQAHLLVDRRSRVDFSHDKIREVAYTKMSPVRRQRLHGRVLQALEQAHANTLEEWAALLAQHAYRARAWKKALDYSVPALKKAVNEYHHQEGLKLADVGLEAAQKLEEAGEDSNYTNDQRFEVLSQQVDIFNLLGKRKEEEQDLAEMERLAGRLRDKTRLGLVFRKMSAMHNAIGTCPVAEESARKALAIYEEIGDKIGQAASLANLGNAYYGQAKYEEALRCYQHDLEIRREAGDIRGQATGLWNIGKVYWSWGKYDASLSYYQQALEAFQQMGDSQGQGNVLNSLGNTYQYQGKYDDALRCHLQALKIRQEIGDKRGLGNSLSNAGNAYYSQGKYGRALRYYRQGLRIRQEIGHKSGEASSLSNIGNVYYSQGKYEEALSYHQQALEICRVTGDKDGQATYLNNSGNECCNLGRYEEALRYHQQALEIRQDLGNKQDEANNWNNLSVVYLHLGQYEKSSDYARKALEINRKLNERHGQGKSLHYLGSAYRWLGRNKQALQCYQQALAIHRETGHRENEGDTLVNVGNVYYEQGQYSEALQHLDQALTIFRKLGVQDTQLECLSMKGLTLWALGDFKQSLSCSTQAVRRLENGQTCEIPQKIYFNYFKILTAHHQSSKALKYLEKAYTEVMQRAVQIRQKNMRKSFLKHHKTSREIVEAWGKHQISKKRKT